MKSNIEIIREVICQHCFEAGISFGDFVEIYAPQIENPELFDSFFKYPFDQICEPAKEKRVELLVHILTN